MLHWIGDQEQDVGEGGDGDGASKLDERRFITTQVESRALWVLDIKKTTTARDGV